MALPGRRRFMGFVAALMSAPVATGRAAAGRRRLGMLFIEPQPPEQVLYPAVAKRLRELGWIEGGNLDIDRAYADADQGRLPALADELVRKGPDVLFADDSPSAIALKRATRTIPVVFFGVASPVEMGLVDSLGRPGGNLTGVANIVSVDEVVAKRLELLREVAPRATRLAWFLTPDLQKNAAGGHLDVTTRLEATARRFGYQPRFHFPADDGDFDSVFKAILAARTEALSVGQSALLIRNRKRIVEFALRHSLPGAFFDHTFVEAGGLLSYGPHFALGHRRCAEYIDRILRGARPDDLPVELPMTMTLQVNRRTAKAMGLSLPDAVLLRADRVYE